MRVMIGIVGFIAVIFICLGLVCAWWKNAQGPEIHFEEARAVSPNQEWTAVAYRYGYKTWGQASANGHIVHLSQRGMEGPRRGSTLWNSFEVPVTNLQWKGNDSVLVSVQIRDDKFVPWLLTTLKAHGSHGVASRTVVTLTPVSPFTGHDTTRVIRP